ncbi:hypothetical protein Aduo_002229 [Ancylostoma duodenale]
MSTRQGEYGEIWGVVLGKDVVDKLRPIPFFLYTTSTLPPWKKLKSSSKGLGNSHFAAFSTHHQYLLQTIRLSTPSSRTLLGVIPPRITQILARAATSTTVDVGSRLAASCKAGWLERRVRSGCGGSSFARHLRCVVEESRSHSAGEGENPREECTSTETRSAAAAMPAFFIRLLSAETLLSEAFDVV